MNFFEDKAGRLYPISAIDRVVPGKIYKPKADGTRPPSRVYLKDAGEFDGIEIYDWTVTEIANSGVPIIPAQPGFVFLGYWPNEDDPEQPLIERHPIIGWKYSVKGGLIPLVLEEYDERHSTVRTAILQPDGVVIRPHDISFDNEAAWRASVKADLEQEAKDRAAKVAGAKA